jgi:hypothetical protein
LCNVKSKVMKIRGGINSEFIVHYGGEQKDSDERMGSSIYVSR